MKRQERLLIWIQYEQSELPQQIVVPCTFMPLTGNGSNLARAKTYLTGGHLGACFLRTVLIIALAPSKLPTKAGTIQP